MANYITTDTELTSIANAIRAKGGTNAQLVFPTGFVSAIQAIQTGSTTVSWETMANQNITIISSSPNYFIVNNYTTPFQADETYRVTWGTGGTQYICQTIYDNTGTSYDGYIIGNPGVVGGEDTGEPFLIYRNSATRLVGATNQSAGTIHLLIEKQVSSGSSTLVAKTITANGTYDPEDDNADGYSEVTVNVPSGSPNLQAKTNVAPTESSQTITADSGYDGLSSVQINAVSSTYIGSGVTKKAAASYTPTETSQTIAAGQYLSGAQTINAISGTYVGSGISRRSSSDVTVSGGDVTVPAGYYSANVSTSVPGGSAKVQSSITGSGATVSTGTNTLTLSSTFTLTPTVTAGYISSGTANTVTVTQTASVTTKAAATITPRATAQTIAAGTYLTGTQTIAGDSNLVSSNILSGKSIFGVAGSVAFQTYYTGSSAPSSSQGVNGDIYLQT